MHSKPVLANKNTRTPIISTFLIIDIATQFAYTKVHDLFYSQFRIPASGNYFRQN
jgi:hypothetical protein